MKANIPRNVIVDTGFWFALFSKGDQHHDKANRIIGQIERATLLIPWPSLYEVLNTRFTKDYFVVKQFETFIKKPTVKRIDDTKYREEALEDTFKFSTISKRNISLVDMVIRAILEDPGFGMIDYLVTFNEKDFIDVLKKRRIQIYYGP
jgi:predicted nucleic acid-binding protein